LQDKKKAKDDRQEKGIRKKSLMSGRGLSPYRPFLRVCKACGVPVAISGNHKWEEHGTILSRDNSQRLIIVEIKILDGILRKAAEMVGEDAERTFLYAKAFDASHYVRSFMTGLKKVILGYPLAKKPFYELLCDQARMLGMADARLVSYVRGEELIIACTHCYNRHFFAGDILGSVYVGEGREADIEIEESGGEIFFKVDMLENTGFSEVEKFKFSWEVPIPGHVNYRRCKKCGTPFAVSFFSWDLSRGLMVDTHNGEPVTLVDAAGMNASYELIKSEQGEAVDEFLAHEVKEMVDTILPGLNWKHRRSEERIRDLFFLAYRGMGNPIFTESIDDGIKARVENPFNYPLVAGIATSFLARGKPVSFEWERTIPGRLEIYLHFK
jgi:hypothetical protein